MYGCSYFGGTYYGSCSSYVVLTPAQLTLGCGVYDVLILARGGASIIGEFPATQIEWARVLDDTSEGHVIIENIPPDCRDVLAQIAPWKHEVAIFRNEELVWVGPVLIPMAPPDAFDVEARDISAWWDHRMIHNDHVYTVDTELATIFKDVSDDAMSVDNSPGLFVGTTPTGHTAQMSLLASQHLMAGAQLRDLASNGVDWTVVRRDVIAGGSVVPTSSIGTFLDHHFSVPPTPKRDGTAKTNVWGIRGSGSGDAGDSVYGSATDAPAGVTDGVLESVDSISTLNDNTSAASAAQSRLDLTKDATILEEAVLSADAPFTIDQLVPGALCDLALEGSVIPVFGQYRLKKVAVTANGDSESVKLTFQPVGTS